MKEQGFVDKRFHKDFRKYFSIEKHMKKIYT
jgi:hypothetical protein